MWEGGFIGFVFFFGFLHSVFGFTQYCLHLVHIGFNLWHFVFNSPNIDFTLRILALTFGVLSLTSPNIVFALRILALTFRILSLGCANIALPNQCQEFLTLTLDPRDKDNILVFKLWF